VATPTIQAERVELDRQAVLDLLLEASIVVDVFETLAGAPATSLTDRLATAVEKVAEELVGDWASPNDPNAKPGEREELWSASLAGAGARFRELAESVTGDVD
jgi:hypothetical protein